MNTLQELNNYGRLTVDVIDLNPSGVVFDRGGVNPGPSNYLFSADAINGSFVVVPEPGINILEVRNYQTANVRYRVRIVGNPTVTGSNVSWGVLPEGVELAVSGNTYTLTGINNKSQWDAVKYFTWSIPSNYATYNAFYLDVAVIYYDSAQEEDIITDWEVYDPNYYEIASLSSSATMTTINRRIKQYSSAMSATFTGDFEIRNIKQSPANLTSAFTVVASAVDARLFASTTQVASADKLRRTSSIQVVDFTQSVTAKRSRQGVSALSSSASVSATITVKPPIRTTAALTSTSSLSGNIEIVPFEVTFNGHPDISIHRVTGTDITIDWGPGAFSPQIQTYGTLNNVSVSKSYVAGTPNLKTVKIYGNLTAINLAKEVEATAGIYSIQFINGKLQSLTMKRTSSPDVGVGVNNSFVGFTAPYLPSSLTNLSGAFYNATNFNQPLDYLNVNQVTNMSQMFYNCDNFNQNLNSWNTSNVTNMSYMFATANAFNGNITNWDTSNVTNMDGMFQSASNFDQDLSGWCVSLIPTKPTLFDTGATFPTWTAAERPVWGTCP